MRQAKFQRNEEIEAKFQKQIQTLEKYAWKKGGLLIRPPKSQQEVADEGEALRHAVACYLGKMSEGVTAILFIRRTSEPDTPFYTLELHPKKLRVLQCCTKHNERYEENPEVLKFVETWLENVVRKV